jgi:glycosyltransferase involved in cell wall biosynthesis
MQKGISVVIPTYNRLWALPKSVRQFYKNELVKEIIVVDDGSTDGTREWLEKEANINSIIKPLYHNKNLGYCAAKNYGIQNAKYDHILTWDDDMLLYPEDGINKLFIELLNNDASLVAPAFVVYEEIGIKINFNYSLKPCKTLLLNKYLLMRKSIREFPKGIAPGTWESLICMSPGLHKRENFDDYRFSEQYGFNAYREETDYQLYLLKNKKKIFVCSSVFAIDMKRPPIGNTGGCHQKGDLLKYELKILQNNWLLLKTNRETIKTHYTKIPIILLQLLFAYNRLLWQLPKKIAYKIFIVKKIKKHASE